MNDDCRFGSQSGWLKEQRILRIGSGIHSLGLRKECAVHSGIILPHTGIFNVYGVPFVGRGNVNTTF